MPNEYFDWPARAASDRFVRFDVVRSADMNDALDDLSNGLAKLPTPAQLWAQRQNYAVATGAANAWSASIAATYLTALVDGMQVRVKFSASNTTTTPTLNLNGLGAKNIVAYNTADIAAGFIEADIVETLVYNSTTDKWHLMKAPDSSDASGVAYNGGSVKQALDDLSGDVTDINAALAAVTMADYAALRAYAGSAYSCYITGFLVSDAPAGISGRFTRDDNDVASADDGGIVIVDAGGRRWKREIAGVVNDAWFETAADGVTNDDATLLSAANAAVSVALPLSLHGETYGITTLSLPAGLCMRTNNATFKDLTGTAGNSPLITVNSQCWVDQLSVLIPTGIVRDRVVVGTGTRPQVDRTIISSVDQQANTSDNDDSAVRLSAATSPRFSFVMVTNYDRAIQLKSSTDAGRMEVLITSYLRGLHIEDCTRVRVTGTIVTTSPNASYSPGHVGVLMSANTDDASRNIKLDGLVVEDAGEHSVRVAGPSRISNWHIDKLVSKNSGGCAVKVLGTDAGVPTSRNRTGFITHLIAEDCGTGGLTSNMCAILLMYCDEVQVVSPIVRKRTKLQSAHTAIRLASVGDIHIVEPDLADATFDGVWADGSLGDIDRLHITGGRVRSCGRDAIRGTTGVNTTTFRNWNVNGTSLENNTGKGLNIAIGGGTLVDSLFRVKVYNNTGGAAACDNAAATLDVFGAVGATPLAGITAANGSRWSDGTTLNIRKAGAWTAL